MQKCHFFYFLFSCHGRVVRLVALALDLAPLARLKVHLDQDQLIHGPSRRILHLLLVHHNLVHLVVHVRPENYGENKTTIRAQVSLAIRDMHIRNSKNSRERIPGPKEETGSSEHSRLTRVAFQKCNDVRPIYRREQVGVLEQCGMVSGSIGHWRSVLIVLRMWREVRVRRVCIRGVHRCRAIIDPVVRVAVSERCDGAQSGRGPYLVVIVFVLIPRAVGTRLFASRGRGE